MKRCEKMTAEQIMDAFNPNNSSICAKIGDCNKYSDASSPGGKCASCVWNYMNEELQMIPRAYTFKNKDEAEMAWIDFVSEHDCSDCRHCEYGEKSAISCKLVWLYELIEKGDDK